MGPQRAGLRACAHRERMKLIFLDLETIAQKTSLIGEKIVFIRLV